LLSRLLQVHALPLKSLNVEGNNLGNAGLIAMCEGLALNQHLTTLNLSHCNVGHHDMKWVAALCGALRATPLLTSVDLDGNYIGTEAAQYLYQTLSPDCKHIRELNITAAVDCTVYNLILAWLRANTPPPVRKVRRGKKKSNLPGGGSVLGTARSLTSSRRSARGSPTAATNLNVSSHMSTSTPTASTTVPSAAAPGTTSSATGPPTNNTSATAVSPPVLASPPRPTPTAKKSG